MQFHAGYLSSTLNNYLLKIKDDEFRLKFEGLVQSLCTFDVFSSINLTIPEDPNPIFSTLYNAVSRGLPTICSPYIESVLSEKLGLTLNDSNEFTINFSLNTKVSIEELFNIFHNIDSRYLNRNKYLNTQYAESNFEKAFLMEYLPQELAFIFDQQRARRTLGANTNNHGRVDFSLEIPYYGAESRENKFKQNVKVKNRKRYIVEVDGAKYHEDLIDDIKDHEIAQFHHTIRHIREYSVINDISELIERLKADEYIKRVLKNCSTPIVEKANEISFLFTPLGIARIQKTILQYLLVNPTESKLSIAIIERDVPCGALALNDLNQLIYHISSLSLGFDPPVIEFDIFTTKEFYNSPLHNGEQKLIGQELDTKNYSIVIDIALLSKSFVINYPISFDERNLITIRNSHFEVIDFNNKIISANPITYKSLVRPIGNEQFDIEENIKESVDFFIQYFFRKKTFRDGQLPIISRALNLKSVIGLLPTGGGKSLTYQLAALLQPGITIVVDPIKSLMFDQFKSLKEIGITRAVFINSSLSPSERRFATSNLEAGNYQFIFISPERYVIKAFRDALLNANKKNNFFSYVVIDEVHCVSEWGHDFRTPYLDLGENAIKYTKTKSGNSIPLIGLTATASFDVLADIERELKIQDDDGNATIRFENTVRDEVNYKIIETDIDLSGLMLTSQNIRNHIGISKTDKLIEWIKDFTGELSIANSDNYIDSVLRQSYQNFIPTYQKSNTDLKGKYPTYEIYKNDQYSILKLNKLEWRNIQNSFEIGVVIFCPHKNGSHGVHSVIDSLNTNLPEISAGYFVGGDNDGEEKDSFEFQEQFINNEIALMVATKAFGMGIDKPNVRGTAHINIPQSIESFVQEAGRAGRDKKISLSTIFLNNQKVELFKNDDQNSKKTYEFWSDREILLYFHNNSFRGKLKERQTLHELRNSITYPSISRLKLLEIELNEVLNVNYITLQFGKGSNQYKIFINDTESGDTLGNYDVEKKISQSYSYSNPIIQSSALNTLKIFVDQINFGNHSDIKEYLLQYTLQRD